MKNIVKNKFYQKNMFHPKSIDIKKSPEKEENHRKPLSLYHTLVKMSMLIHLNPKIANHFPY